jgi:tRNA(Arg) A34 adenosine deaminase TadA
MIGVIHMTLRDSAQHSVTLSLKSVLDPNIQQESENIALLRDGQTVYYARSAAGCPPLQAAPIVLIQGIYDHSPEQARRLVRNRIFTTTPLSESISGIVKVAAKRITASLALHNDHFKINSDDRVFEFHAQSIARPSSPSIPSGGNFPEPPQETLLGHSDFMALAFRLAGQVDRREARYASNRPIAAILVSNENQILAAAVNTNAKNRTLHAEMNLIASLKEQRIPPRARLYTTLKPCKMCAGMIFDSAMEPESLQVIYGENDPGPHARHTALDRHKFPSQSQL